MRLTIMLGLTLTPSVGYGTSCWDEVLPCLRVRPDNVLLIGEIVEKVRPVPSPGLFERGTHYSEFRVTVTESFAAQVEAGTSLMIDLPSASALGTTSFFELLKGAEGKYHVALCGLSGSPDEVGASSILRNMVKFLRARKAGAADTGALALVPLSYKVLGEERWPEDVEIVLENGNERRSGTIPVSSFVAFHSLTPGRYTVSARKPRFVEGPNTIKVIDVTPDTCVMKGVSLVPEAR